MKGCNRLNSIPPYHFVKLDKLKSEIAQKGLDVVDISIGDPDLPTPDFIVSSLMDACKDKKNYGYPPYEGTYEFRRAVADYYKRRYCVELDPDGEVITLIGSKEGIAHLSLALVDVGDIGLVPDPGYPIYKSSICIAGGVPYIMPLKEDNSFLPDIDVISDEVADKAKLMYINYPNNPTGAVCDSVTFESIVKFAAKHDIIVCNDGAYNELVFDGNKAASILSIEGAKKVAVELGTLSKSYNMTGWRIGYAVGNKDILKKIMIIKSNTDSSQFAVIQHAACTALNHGDGYIDYLRWIYEGRRNNAIKLLKSVGIRPITPKGSFYIWFKVPDGCTSYEYASKMASQYGVIVTPGRAFGNFGEGYCRIALTYDEGQFKKVIDRIKRSMGSLG